MAVLVVDDSAETCRVLRDLLRSGGHHDVITAGSAEEAFSHLGIGSSSDHTDRFDLVLMDLGMPGMSGVEACRVIKSDEKSQDIPVLLVTGQPESHHVQAAFAAGAQDFIRKPVERSVLLARVHVAQQYKREIDRRKQRERELLRT
ncbi:MAG: response regulator, partial [Chloroflexi bacterium]|nr:response regulator [Chloroflexota bacterium]